MGKSVRRERNGNEGRRKGEGTLIPDFTQISLHTIEKLEWVRRWLELEERPRFLFSSFNHSHFLPPI